MALLAEEVCSCKADLLTGGMSGDNASTIISHVCDGKPILIPYLLYTYTYNDCPFLKVL